MYSHQRLNNFCYFNTTFTIVSLEEMLCVGRCYWVLSQYQLYLTQIEELLTIYTQGKDSCTIHQQ